MSFVKVGGFFNLPFAVSLMSALVPSLSTSGLPCAFESSENAEKKKHLSHRNKYLRH